MKFEDITFTRRGELPGIQALVWFPNGYGASIVRGMGTYGSNEGLYELAVVCRKGADTEEWKITYDTPVASDVLGWLDESEIEAHLASIEALPKPDETEQAS